MSLLSRPDFDALNSQIRYLMFSVFQVEPGVLGDDREAVIKQALLFVEGQADKGVMIRGLYDVAGLRADADFMIWTALGEHRSPPGHLRRLPPHHRPGPREQARVEQRRVPPSRRIQQEPHSGLPGR
jgi:hypothetical protein